MAKTALEYLQSYREKVVDTGNPLDALKAWPIIPTTSKKLVTVKMAKTVFDMRLVGNETEATKKVCSGLEKLNCPSLDTDITSPEQKPQQSTLGAFVSSVTSMFQRPTPKTKPSEAVTESYVAHPYDVSDILNVFDFMEKTGSLDPKDLSDEDIAGILLFIQDGYEKLEQKDDYNRILKRLPFYKAINGKHYKLSEFSEYAVIPAGVPTEEIDILQDETRCLFLHSDLLPTLEQLLAHLDAGAKRTIANFYITYILPNFHIFSDEMQLKFLTHIRDDVLPRLYGDDDERSSLLDNLKKTRCIRDDTGEYVHAMEFYDPRHEILWIMEDESSRKFPPPPFGTEEWLDFLVSIGMVNDVDETLFMKFAGCVARAGNSSPTNETNRNRSKALLSFFVKKHHLHNPQFLEDLSTVKFIASEKVEHAYLSLHKQYCCGESSNHPPFVQFSNAVPWKYRSLVWTSAYLIPDRREFICSEFPQCRIESLYERLQVKYPSPGMVISHLQNISGVLAKYSKEEKQLPLNEELTRIMAGIYEFLQKATKCPHAEISAECSITCLTIGTRLANTHCILVDDDKVIVKADQLSFKIRQERALEPFIYEVPRGYGKLEHLLKRLGATETITPLQLANVFKEMSDRSRGEVMNPEFQKKAPYAMLLLFESVLEEAKDENRKSSLINVKELYLPSEDNRLVKSSELLCKIPPQHSKTIARLPYHALYPFEKCGLEREKESQYLDALPEKLRPKPFHDVVEEKLDESCLETPCRLCVEIDCEFIEKFKELLKSKQFKDGIIRLLKHQKTSSALSSNNVQVASRLFSNMVEIKCMETVRIHLIRSDTKEVLDGSSFRRKCYVVRLRDAWTLYLQHGASGMQGSLAKSINKILDWKIKDEFLVVICDILNCATPSEIPEALDSNNIQIDAGKNEDLELGCEIPVVFHQLLQQNPLFLFRVGERVAYYAELPDEDHDDLGEASSIKYVLAEILRLVTPNSVEGAYDLEARYLIDIGNERREVSVLDLYKFYSEYPEENPCKDMVLFTGPESAKPTSYEEAEREILEALRAAWRLPQDLRRKAIRRLYLRWHPDKNPNNVEFATRMMAFLLEQIKRMEEEERRLGQRREHFNFEDMFARCARQASREKATYRNYCSSTSFSSSSSFHFSRSTFDSAETYTTPNPGEARRWIEQAEGDLSSCEFLLATQPYHALACFQSQQIVEKSLKAALYAECGLTGDQLHTHDVYRLAMDVKNLPRWRRADVLSLASVVANYYIPTRYPNQQPRAIVPFNAYNDKSREAMRVAKQIFRAVREFIGR